MTLTDFTSLLHVDTTAQPIEGSDVKDAEELSRSEWLAVAMKKHPEVSISMCDTLNTHSCLSPIDS